MSLMGLYCTVILSTILVYALADCIIKYCMASCPSLLLSDRSPNMSKLHHARVCESHTCYHMFTSKSAASQSLASHARAHVMSKRSHLDWSKEARAITICCRERADTFAAHASMKAVARVSCAGVRDVRQPASRWFDPPGRPR